MKDSDHKPLTNDAGTPYPAASIRLPLGRMDMPCCKTIISSKLANFKRERILEHRTHVKSSGATTCLLDEERNTIIYSSAVRQFTQ